MEISLLVLTLAATTLASGLVLIITTVVCIVRKNVLKKRKEKKQLGGLLSNLYKSILHFPYESLESATNYFQNSKKLGEGRYGSVYKGILPDGKVVAVKRLFFKSKQTADDFFNKVNLISGINHKNLVKLLGCSITGPESLLVYEYVPNQSLLDNFSGIEIILNSCSYKNINFSYSVHLLVRLLSQLKLILS
ncbi:cysteine-rich receptor-like protein kinase 3 [Quercus lobata]|uniref:cysteine-rich receptor-like protein kinase 3 n=1 Tax=Quercus lobata TaxID=97700 RepID=UPI001248D134|nr:cysteine-rich receptor-like protein kinase 3 [Quercus lobata]